eukprot:4371900-Prymnesium_polylepis.1
MQKRTTQLRSMPNGCSKREAFNGSRLRSNAVMTSCTNSAESITVMATCMYLWPGGTTPRQNTMESVVGGTGVRPGPWQGSGMCGAPTFRRATTS